MKPSGGIGPCWAHPASRLRLPISILKVCLSALLGPLCGLRVEHGRKLRRQLAPTEPNRGKLAAHVSRWWQQRASGAWGRQWRRELPFAAPGAGNENSLSGTVGKRSFRGQILAEEPFGSKFLPSEGPLGRQLTYLCWNHCETALLGQILAEDLVGSKFLPSEGPWRAGN